MLLKKKLTSPSNHVFCLFRRDSLHLCLSLLLFVAHDTPSQFTTRNNNSNTFKYRQKQVLSPLLIHRSEGVRKLGLQNSDFASWLTCWRTASFFCAGLAVTRTPACSVGILPRCQRRLHGGNLLANTQLPLTRIPSLNRVMDHKQIDTRIYRYVRIGIREPGTHTSSIDTHKYICLETHT